MCWKSWLRYRIFLYVLLGLAAVDVLVFSKRRQLAAYDPDDYLERVENCLRQRPDLVLIGGSVVAEGLDPAAFAGLVWQGQPLNRPFNLGLAGGTSSEVWHAVKHSLPIPPRLLIYAITASDLNDDRQAPHGPWSLMDSGDLLHWLRHRPESREWVCRTFFQGQCARLWQLYSYRNAIRLWAADRANRLWPSCFPEAAQEARRNLGYMTDMLRPDGFAPQQAARKQRLDRYRAAGCVGPSYWAMKKYRISGGHFLYLNHLLDWAERNGTSVILVDMPVSADLEERMHPREFAAYRAVLADTARNRQVPLIHADRKVLGLTDGDFSDEVHLNGAGSAKVSAWLRRNVERETR